MSTLWPQKGKGQKSVVMIQFASFNKTVRFLLIKSVELPQNSSEYSQCATDKFCIWLQIFAYEEKTFTALWNANGPSRLSVDERLHNLKKDRMAIAEILLQAGSTCASLQHTASQPEHGDNLALTRSSILDKNLASGGPEVLELVSQARPLPRSLLSMCRLVVRRGLSPPILLQNVDKLPLPYPLKQYVAIETLGFSLSQPY